MKKRVILSFVLAVLVTVVSSLVPVNETVYGAEEDHYKIAILHTNDEHAAIDGFAKIAWKKQQLLNSGQFDDVLLVSAGDAFSGNAVVDRYKENGQSLPGKPMVDLMNAAGYDITTIGNHGFDYGQQRLQASIDNTNFPKVLANLEVDSTEADMKQPEPYAAVKAENTGLKFNFIGLIQVDGEYPATLPANLYGLDFLDPFQTAAEYTHLADKEGIFVGLTHLGHEGDRKLAKQMGGLDLIIGGHSHTVVQEPSLVNDVLVTQAGGDLEYLGKITLTIDRDTKEIVSRSGELIKVKNIKGSDKEVAALIDDFKGQMDQILSEKLDTLTEPITGAEDLGAFMTDALTEGPALKKSGYQDIDFSFQNSGGIRVDALPKGKVTVGDILELEPFGNNIIVFDDLTLSEIKSLLRKDYQERGYVDLRASGLKYRIIEKDGEVAEIKLTDYQGNPLPKDKTYTVALNNYIVTSYDYNFDPDRGENTYVLHNDAIIEYVKYLNKQAEEDWAARYQDLSRTGVEIKGGKVIGQTEVKLTSNNKTAGSTTSGNLITTAVKEATGADIATFPSYSGLVEGTVIKAGSEVTDQKLTALYDYIDANQMVVGKISGADLEKFILKRCQNYDNADLQVAGMEYTLKTDNEGNIIGIETDLEPNKKYTVTFDSYQYSDQYNLQGMYNKQYTTELNEQEMLFKYVKQLETIPNRIAEDRVVIK